MEQRISSDDRGKWEQMMVFFRMDNEDAFLMQMSDEEDGSLE